MREQFKLRMGQVENEMIQVASQVQLGIVISVSEYNYINDVLVTRFGAILTYYNT